MRKIPKIVIGKPEDDLFPGERRMRESTIFFGGWVSVVKHGDSYGLDIGKKFCMPGGFFDNMELPKPVIFITRQYNLWKTFRLCVHEFCHYMNWFLLKKSAPGWCEKLDRCVDKYLR